MRYSLSEIAAVCGGVFYGADTQVRSVVTDSRRSTGGDDAPMFVAMHGANHDGHDFIGDLYARGVRAFMVEDDVDFGAYPLAGFVKVPRSLYGLQTLAAHYRSTFRGIMVAVTGSSGKTSVKEWIAQLAPRGKKIFRSPRSYNSQLGVALSVLMMDGDEDMALIEAGISRPGEMARLADVVRPDIGVFTGLGPEHGENFVSDEEKMREKARLFKTCGSIVFCGGDDMVERILREAAPHARLVDARGMEPRIPVLHDARMERSKVAVAAAFLDMVTGDCSGVLGRVAELGVVDVRLDIREGIAGSLLVTDPDNSDINSLPIALDRLRAVAGERDTVLIVSDIKFSPLPEDELYARVADAVAKAGIDSVVGIGERICRYGRLFASGSEFYQSAEEFVRRFRQDDIRGKAVMLRVGMDAGYVGIVRLLDRKSHTTVLEVDLDAMIGNLDYFRSLVGGRKIMAMVKASSYGNGNYEVANMLHAQGVDYLAVAFADEGVRLREQDIAMPIVVLNADQDSFPLMVANRLEPEIYNFRSLRMFVDAVRMAGETSWPIHIKIDTGMHRLGFRHEDMPELVEMLRREASGVVVRSVFSHLAVADVPEEDEFTRSQIDYFTTAVDMLSEGIGYVPIRHILNSAGIERFPEARFDMCRLGIGLYGLSAVGNGAVRPVSRLVTRIVQLKELDPSQTVGYGRCGRFERVSRLATIPVGYADGLDRRLGCGVWSMEVNGRKAPVVGRICMDSCMIDVTGIDVAEGDEVVVFGGGAGNGVADMAALLGTIPYEIMTSVSERVKRIYLKA